MKTNIHKINGFIYVTSEGLINNTDYITDGYLVWQWKDNSSLLGRKKVVLTNDYTLLSIQQLTKEEEAYCMTVESVEIRSLKTIPSFMLTGNSHCLYQLQLPKQEQEVCPLCETNKLVDGVCNKCTESVCQPIKKEETIEEVANRYSGYHKSYIDKTDVKGSAFLDGYNQAVKTLYNDEEVKDLLYKQTEYFLRSNARMTIEEFFNQNKKK